MMNFGEESRTCHPERVSRSPERSEGEGSMADLQVITRLSYLRRNTHEASIMSDTSVSGGGIIFSKLYIEALWQNTLHR